MKTLKHSLRQPLQQKQTKDHCNSMTRSDTKNKQKNHRILKNTLNKKYET
jgi:hypothetical protein